MYEYIFKYFMMTTVVVLRVFLDVTNWRAAFEMPLSQSQTRPLLNNIDGNQTSIQNDIYLSRLENNHNNHVSRDHFPPLKNGEEELPPLLATTLPALQPSSALPAVTLSNDSAKCQKPNKTCPTKSKTKFATPEKVVNEYLSKLTPYEQMEIFKYPEIYCIGATAEKRPGIIGSINNCGYDNEHGSYIHVPHDHIAYRYEVIRVSS